MPEVVTPRRRRTARGRRWRRVDRRRRLPHGGRLVGVAEIDVVDGEIGAERETGQDQRPRGAGPAPGQREHGHSRNGRVDEDLVARRARSCRPRGTSPRRRAGPRGSGAPTPLDPRTCRRRGRARGRRAAARAPAGARSRWRAPGRPARRPSRRSRGTTPARRSRGPRRPARTGAASPATRPTSA